MKVKDFMSRGIFSCYQDQTVGEAAMVMMENGFSCLPILERSGKLVGILTESDFVGKEIIVPHAMTAMRNLLGQVYYKDDVEKIYEQAKDKKLEAVMTKNPVFVSSEATLNDVIDLMSRKGVKRMPVVDNGELMGIVTRKDLLRAFNRISRKDVE